MKIKNGIVLCLAAAAVGASAQIVPSPLGILVRAGTFQPSSGTGSAIGEGWFAAGIEMDIFKLRLGPIDPLGARISLSVDTYNRGSASSLPILVNFAGNQNRLKYSFGVGVAVADLPGQETEINFAYQLSLGYHIPWTGLPIIAEVRFFGVSGVDTALDGFALTLGIKL